MCLPAAGANQQWKHLGTGQIAALTDPKLCLSGDTTGLTLRSCNTADSNQIWAYNRAGQLKANGRCADINGGALNNPNAAVTLYSCGNAQPNQTWSAPFSTPPKP